MYGYPQYARSKFELKVTINKPVADQSQNSDGLPDHNSDPPEDPHEERSNMRMIWPVLANILEIVIEVIL